MSKNSVSLENVNLFLVNNKIDEFLAQNNLQATEARCRLVQVVLRHKVHHFPVNIPFIAAVKKCDNGQQVVYKIKRSKIAAIDDIAISSETKVGQSFQIDRVTYEAVDTISGFARYKPIFNLKKSK